MTNDDQAPIPPQSPAEQEIATTIEQAEPYRFDLDAAIAACVADLDKEIPEILREELADLKESDLPRYKKLVEKLKKAGWPVKAIAGTGKGLSGDGATDQTQSEQLVALADKAQLFHDQDGKAYADCEIDDRRVTMAISGPAFKKWLGQQFFEATGKAPNREALKSALDALEAQALYRGPRVEVFTRVAEHDGKTYLDLGDPTWRAIELSAQGWSVVDHPPIRFRRPVGMLPLPVPVPGGSVNALRRFLNVKTDNDFCLAVSWILAALRPTGPYPVMVIAGEQGSAKSTFSAIMRRLTDPNKAPLRPLPREERDLFIAALNGHVHVFDNCSGLPPWMSDALCRLATGGAFATRQLYSDTDEVLINAVRPIILNGIEDTATRPDLADRSVFLTLEPIPEHLRRPEKELWAELEAEWPAILGALLDAYVIGLRNLPHVKLATLPRMADFAIWATACEPALWPPGTFAAAYAENRANAVETVISSDPVASAILELMKGRDSWEGTATELLEELGQLVSEQTRRSKSWPSAANGLTGKLRRAMPALRTEGITVDEYREGRGRHRKIHITKLETPEPPNNGGNRSSASSASSAAAKPNSLFNGLADRDELPFADDPNAGENIVRGIVRTNPLNNNDIPHADDADDLLRTSSGHPKRNWETRF